MNHVFRLTPVFIGLSLWAQAPAPLAFDVATIKPAQMPTPADMMAGKMHAGVKIENSRVDIGLTPLSELIRLAYEVKYYQVTGPEWLKTERFDVIATFPQGATKEQVPAMMRALLADRFKLTIHKESKPLPMYALIVGKGGSKLKAAEPNPALPEDGLPAGKGGMMMNSGDGTAIRVNPNSDGKGGAVMSDAKGNTTKMTMTPEGTMHMEASAMDIPGFVEMITRFLDKPVVDETGLKGRYQMAIDLSMADMMRAARAAGVNIPGGGPGGPGGPGGAASDASDPGGGATIFAGVQALGLKLEPRKDPVEMIVVDHMEKTPSEN